MLLHLQVIQSVHQFLYVTDDVTTGNVQKVAEAAHLQSHITNMHNDHTKSTTTMPNNDSGVAKRQMMRINSKKMVNPPTQAA